MAGIARRIGAARARFGATGAPPLPTRWKQIHRRMLAVPCFSSPPFCWAPARTSPPSRSDPGTAASRPTSGGTGLVSAADPRAAEAGAAILRQGGSATDAAIATMLALTVVEPQSSGIGGGGFLLRGTSAGPVETLDGRETAPAGADPQWFLDPDGKPLPFMQAVISGRQRRRCRAMCALPPRRTRAGARCRGPRCSSRPSRSPARRC